MRPKAFVMLNQVSNNVAIVVLKMDTGNHHFPRYVHDHDNPSVLRAIVAIALDDGNGPWTVVPGSLPSACHSFSSIPHTDVLPEGL